jgi:predicted transcriptional regulator of viral defense system
MPQINHLTKERPKYGKANSNFQLTTEIIKSEYQKAAKISKRSAKYDGYAFNFFEREFTGKEGVISVQNPITKKMQVQTTSIERTLLDIAIAPHHVGGFQEACKLWKLIYANSHPNLSQMQAIYAKLNYKYPYWQRIGLILKNEVGQKKATEWKLNFPVPELIFYADREPQENWHFDSEWNMNFPK